MRVPDDGAFTQAPPVPVASRGNGRRALRPDACPTTSRRLALPPGSALPTPFPPGDFAALVPCDDSFEAAKASSFLRPFPTCRPTIA